MNPISYFHKEEEVKKYSEKISRANFVVNKLIELTILAFTSLNILLIIRFLLILLKANRVDIVNLVFNITDSFIGPFVGIFTTTDLFFEGVIHWDILIAIIFYSILCWIIVSILNVFKAK